MQFVVALNGLDYLTLKQVAKQVNELGTHTRIPLNLSKVKFINALSTLSEYAEVYDLLLCNVFPFKQYKSKKEIKDRKLFFQSFKNQNLPTPKFDLEISKIDISTVVRNPTRETTVDSKKYTADLHQSFSSIGFMTQQGLHCKGEYADRVLSALWPEYPVHLRPHGYITCATIEIRKVTKLNSAGVNVKVRIPKTSTVIQANEVLRNSADQGTSYTIYDTQPLFSSKTVNKNGRYYAGESVFLRENIVSIDWNVNKIEVKKPQHKETSTIRKSSVKSKISWGTGYIACNLPDNVAMGIPVSLPDCPPNMRLVLEPHGNITLYQEGVVFSSIGRWKKEYNKKQNTLIASGFYHETVNPKWVETLDSKINQIFSSSLRSVDRHLDDLFYSSYGNQGRQYLGKRTNRQKKRLKGQARKFCFSLYDKDFRKLPHHVTLACERLKQDQSLTPDKRKDFNDILVGYYAYKIKS